MAYRFEATSSQYLLASTAAVAGTPFSVSCWFQLDSTDDALVLFLLNNFSVQFDYFRLAYLPGTGLMANVWTSSSTSAVATASPSAGVWHHAGGVFAASDSRACYLDGGNKGTDSTTMEPSGFNQTVLGAIERETNPLYYTGEIAEVAVWDAALSDEEMALLGKGISPLCMSWRLPNLVLYQDLIRPLNRLGIGPAFSAAGGPTVVAHPRAIYPSNPAMGLHAFPTWVPPLRPAAALADASRAIQGAATVAGPSVGESYPIGEVSS